MPGLYAVGVNNQILGRRALMVIDERLDPKAEANYGSILLLLVWKTKSGLIVSLYSGGDAEWYQEEALGHWLNGTQVSVVKADHHGSRAGTSTNFMFSARPDFFLISAGRQYGHPDTKQQQHADSEEAKREWAKSNNFLKTWTSGTSVFQFRR